MVTNKILSFFITVTSLLIIPAQFVTTFILGILVSLTFGLLLIPISFVWIALFLCPLAGLSYMYEKTVFLRPLSSIIGIPLALLANTYVALVPAMGELDSRYAKLIICQTFPFTWSYLQLTKGKDTIEQNDGLTKALQEISKVGPISTYLDTLRSDIISRPYYINKDYKLDW